jgi:hypothetical protein
MIINNAFVMSANAEMLQALAAAVSMTQAQIDHANKKRKLAQHVCTKFSNSATLSTAYAAGTLDHATLCNDALNALCAAADAQAQANSANSANSEQQASASQRKPVKSAKAWLRELLSAADAEYTLAQLVALTGKTEVNIRTMLSDLRSAKYAGKAGVFNTKSVRKNGAVHYSKA